MNRFSGLVFVVIRRSIRHRLEDDEDEGEEGKTLSDNDVTSRTANNDQQQQHADMISRQFSSASASTSTTSHQERRLARISVSIVWLFTFCHAWKAVPTVYEAASSENGLEVVGWPLALIVVEHLSHSLIVFNSAVNFLIYAVS